MPIIDYGTVFGPSIKRLFTTKNYIAKELEKSINQLKLFEINAVKHLTKPVLPEQNSADVCHVEDKSVYQIVQSALISSKKNLQALESPTSSLAKQLEAENSPEAKDLLKQYNQAKAKKQSLLALNEFFDIGETLISSLPTLHYLLTQLLLYKKINIIDKKLITMYLGAMEGLLQAYTALDLSISSLSKDDTILLIGSQIISDKFCGEEFKVFVTNIKKVINLGGDIQTKIASDNNVKNKISKIISEIEKKKRAQANEITSFLIISDKTMDGYLIKPVQSFLKYKMHLDTMIKCIKDENSTDSEKVMTNLGNAKKSVSVCSDYLNDIESGSLNDFINNRAKPSLPNVSSSFVKESSIIVVDSIPGSESDRESDSSGTPLSTCESLASSQDLLPQEDKTAGESYLSMIQQAEVPLLSDSPPVSSSTLESSVSSASSSKWGWITAYMTWSPNVSNQSASAEVVTPIDEAKSKASYWNWNFGAGIFNYFLPVQATESPQEISFVGTSKNVEDSSTDRTDAPIEQFKGSSEQKGASKVESSFFSIFSSLGLSRSAAPEQVPTATETVLSSEQPLEKSEVSAQLDSPNPDVENLVSENNINKDANVLGAPSLMGIGALEQIEESKSSLPLLFVKPVVTENQVPESPAQPQKSKHSYWKYGHHVLTAVAIGLFIGLMFAFPPASMLLGIVAAYAIPTVYAALIGLGAVCVTVISTTLSNLFADFIYKKIDKPENTSLSFVIKHVMPSLTTGLVLGIVLAVCIACPPVGLAIPAAIAIGAIFSTIAFATCLIAKGLAIGMERCGDKEPEAPGELSGIDRTNSRKSLLDSELDRTNEIAHHPSLISNKINKEDTELEFQHPLLGKIVFQ